MKFLLKTTFLILSLATSVGIGQYCQPYPFAYTGSVQLLAAEKHGLSYTMNQAFIDAENLPRMEN